jgi:cytochrome c oxidase assembly factor CtaG
MTTGGLILTGWDWEPSVLIGCGVLVFLYWRLVRPRRRREFALFIAGDLVLLLALVSPIDSLADEYLFSVHMVQHLLLVLAVPPLLIAGLSREFVEGLLRGPRLARIEQVCARPLLAWVAAGAGFVFWHIPLFYNAALAHEGVHIVEHLTFLITATMYWWPLLHPMEESRLSVGKAVVYLFSASMLNTVLGIWITFAPLGSYPAYIQPKDTLGALSLIRDAWGISARTDQQLGGLLMWVPAGLVYFSAIVAIVARWQSEAEFCEVIEPQRGERNGR